MAAKHDGKRARNNLWVTHQNLARAKGGRPAYQPKVKAAKKDAEPARDETATPTASGEGDTTSAKTTSEPPKRAKKE